MTKDEALKEALYLIEAFENGADAEDYYMDICRFKEALEQPVVKDSLTAQKQWQGLSGDEIGEAQPPIDVKMSMDEFMDTFARAIEAKLKELNTK